MHPDVKYISAPGGLLFAYCPFWRPEAWRFFTYILVHDGPTHLTKNLIIQLFLGVALEWNHSWWRISLIYVSGVAAGSMGTSIFKPNAMLVGASGGVFALITAHIATIILVPKNIYLIVNHPLKLYMRRTIRKWTLPLSSSFVCLSFVYRICTKNETFAISLERWLDYWLEFVSYAILRCNDGKTGFGGSHLRFICPLCTSVFVGIFSMPNDFRHNRFRGTVLLKTKTTTF